MNTDPFGHTVIFFEGSGGNGFFISFRWMLSAKGVFYDKIL